MIDYEVLCQTIEDWRAGRRPSIDLSAATPAATPQGYAEEAYEVDADGYEHEGQYDQGQYDQGEYDEYGAPVHVAGGGTSPVDLDEVEPPPYAEGEDEPESVSLSDDDSSY